MTIMELPEAVRTPYRQKPRYVVYYEYIAKLRIPAVCHGSLSLPLGDDVHAGMTFDTLESYLTSNYALMMEVTVTRFVFHDEYGQPHHHRRSSHPRFLHAY